MIIPVRCFTCGKVVGNKWEKYIQLVEEGNNEKYVTCGWYGVFALGVVGFMFFLSMLSLLSLSSVLIGVVFIALMQK